jgi:pyruvate dehydrogenase E2 component (dihydrolipoamide acetyltransferase)
VDSATVANILVSQGSRIEKDQVILELETEKAVGPIPSPAAGTVTKIHVKAGDEVAVGQVLISVAEEGAAAEAARERKREDQATVEARASAPAPPQPASEYRYDSLSGFPPPAAPAVTKIARELGIDLTRVRGSARGGRITLEDLRAYVQRLQQLAYGARPAAEKAEAAVARGIDFSRWGAVEKKKLSSLRRTVGQRMHESWSAIPHVTQFDEADITDLLALRKKFAPSFEKRGAHLTLTPFVMKALVAALKKHPAFNSSLDEASEEVVFKSYYHFGVAVDTEAGLIVPVVRDVDKKSMRELAAELNGLVERTRQRKVSLEELQGSSFTISNQGGIGGGHFTPIINKPNVAILGLGRAARRPALKKDKAEERMMLPLCLSYDHRVVDGADAVRFMNELVQTLQNFPEKELKG